MSSIHVKPDVLNNLPSDYTPLLSQFDEMHIKSMQDAYLAGHDLAPDVETSLFGTLAAQNPDGSALRFPAHAQILASLTTALGWSLAAPDSLKVGKASAAAAATITQKKVRASCREQCAECGPLNNMLQAERSDLLGWMKDWKGSAEHQCKIKTAVSCPAEELSCTKRGVSVIGHADFGVKRVGWPSTDIPAIPYDRPVPRYFRTLVVVNEGSKPVVLLDICGVPSIDQTFVLHDDYGLAHHYDVGQKQQPGYDGSSGVTIKAGAQYQVTVELKCNQQDIAWHQQWLLFIFGAENASERESTQIFVIGRRVSALIGHNIQDVQRCLSTEAKPFYPAALRGLFDSKPLMYEVVHESVGNNFRSWRMPMPAFCQTHVLSVWPQHVSRLEEAADTRVLAPPSLNQAQPCECIVQQLRQLAHLLALEEAAMERDIKEYDLFNVQLTHLQLFNFVLQVPGLPENRPSVFIGDLIYIRSERNPHMECAAEVVAVEYQPKPQLILKLPRDFIRICQTHPSQMLVHVRFTFDRLVLTRMHNALVKVTMSSAPLLPCICSKGVWAESNNLRMPTAEQTKRISSDMPPATRYNVSWLISLSLLERTV